MLNIFVNDLLGNHLPSGVDPERILAGRPVHEEYKESEMLGYDESQKLTQVVREPILRHGYQKRMINWIEGAVAATTKKEEEEAQAMIKKNTFFDRRDLPKGPAPTWVGLI